MAHQDQMLFCKSVKYLFPNLFKNCDVLDIGSLDINGNNRYLFDNCEYTGVDIGEGPNVDVVSRGHEFKPNKLYDVVISTECFEHDKYWKDTILNCINLTKKGGIFLFTCASLGRPEHGTKRSGSEWASPFTTIEWQEEYYRNLTEDDIRSVIDLESNFSEYKFEYNIKSYDLYFYGIKK